jgi:hypothetical protein
MSDPIFPGYRRNDDITELLVDAVIMAIRAHPEQRLSQLMINVLGRDSWNLRDEDAITRLYGVADAPIPSIGSNKPKGFCGAIRNDVVCNEPKGHQPPHRRTSVVAEWE